MSRFFLLVTGATLLATACGGSTTRNGTPSSDSGAAGAGNCPDAPTVIAANQNFPGPVAADNEYVYWVVSVLPEAGAPNTGVVGKVLRAPAGACSATPSVFASTSEISGMTLNADSVFWADASGLASRPKAGGPITQLGKGGSGPLFADATDLFFTSVTSLDELDLASHKTRVLYSSSSDIRGVAANAQSVFFTAGDSVWRVPRAGGSATPIATGQLSPFGIAVNKTGVYWVDAGKSGVDTWSGGGSLMAAPLAGGAPRTLASGLVGPTSLAIDAANGFVAGSPIEAERIPLLRVPLAGGTPVTLVAELSGQLGSSSLVAVNDTAAYYVLRDSLNRVAKSYTP